MKLHRLELTAFGPFGETARVDFDELGADGLFLLHGHTGAGKTTVLDAIAFALYGRVPGARGESKRLHSDHADPQTRPQVVLEATLGGRRLRLIRSPEFERPKKRGTGMRTEQPSATLEWLDGQGQNLSRIPDIGDEVSRLLGMSADQFFQVVLLPQGDFARFLRSDNEDREKLLERLFDTERFGVVEQWLVQRRRESSALLENHRQSVDRLIAQVAVTAGLGAAEAVNPLDAVEWSQRLLAEARAESQSAASTMAQLQQNSAELESAAEEQRRIRERRERGAVARRQLEDYTAATDHREQVRADLERSRRVEPVAAALAEARTAAVTLRRRGEGALELAERLAGRLLEPESAELPGTAWAAADLAAGELRDTETAVELSVLCESASDDPDHGDPYDKAFDVADERTDGPAEVGAGKAVVGVAESGASSRSAVADSVPVDIAASGEPDELGLFSLDFVSSNAAAGSPQHSGVRTGSDHPRTSATPNTGSTDHTDRSEYTRSDSADRIDGPDALRSNSTDRVEGSDGLRPGSTVRIDGSHDPRPETAERTGNPGAARFGSDRSPAPRIEMAVQRWSAQIGSLEEVRTDAESAGRVSAELAGLRSDHASVTGELKQLSEQREQLPEAIRSAESALREAADAKVALPGVQRECEQARAAAEAAVELVRTRTELTTATEEFERARAAHSDARERTLDLRERRLAGMAAELAGALVAGQPCGVCGSPEHPEPARPAAVTVAKSDEDEAVRAERAAEQRRDRTLAHRTELERRVELLTERGGDGDPAQLAAARDAADERLRTTRASAAAAQDLTETVARLRGTDTELNARLRDLESRSSAIQERILAADRRLGELTARVRAAAGADRTVERRRARLENLIADATDLLTARGEATVAEDQFADLARRVEQAARAADLPVADGGVPDGTPGNAVLAEYAKVVAAASRTPQQQADLDAELVTADRLRAHAEAVLAEPEVQAAAATAPVDLAGLEAEVAEARRRCDAAVAAQADGARRVAQLEELSGQLWAAADRIAPLQRAHTELADLSEVVAGRGANNRKMSLRSYVLAARLEEVAVAGSARLRRMSGGRYEFVHSDAAGPRGRRGGLGLDIRDDYTGAVRPAKTLSGGETFMASLSLALGLADVVAAESGGLVLDTLFIDEGFGSLDADTLDAVMGVLDELRSGGRVVGVVSHVDEMRQRIPSRLHVIRDPNGSRLQAIVA
ncbi:putative exonuclease SbcCD, subunit C [Nocardia nova SH22a]|uniref:Nuclease SbcCD subunit C n=1 Tax=Nocardia nova SH22a TaxID=1415166 RepID=W5TPV3_9NOCA|nr:SMC family ATPase [Nocardia nova]AHH21297.1 putative exonuclease SbcCD, subunit C [Nocardia nova SH22a]